MMRSGSGGWWVLWKQQGMVMGVEKDDGKREKGWLGCQDVCRGLSKGGWKHQDGWHY
jgi:hypothetical protein